jgi:hypothetical protein
MNVSDAQLQDLRSFHDFTAWVVAAGIGVLSSVAVFMSFVGS